MTITAITDKKIASPTACQGIQSTVIVKPFPARPAPTHIQGKTDNDVTKTKEYQLTL